MARSSLPNAALLLMLLITICAAFPVDLVVRSDPTPDDPAVKEHLRRQTDLIATEKLERQGKHYNRGAIWKIPMLTYV